MTVADLSNVWLTASVQEKDISQIKPGHEVDAVFAAYPNETFHGKVRSIGDLLDPDTRAIKVRVVVQNPEGRLRPGMFASVTFVGLSAQKALLLQVGFEVAEIRHRSHPPRRRRGTSWR